MFLASVLAHLNNRFDFMRLLHFADVVGRVGLCGFYTLIIASKVGVIQRLLSQDVLSAKDIATAGAEVSVIAFSAAIFVAVIARLPPIRSVDGVEPYVTAIVGTFLIGVIAFLPPPMTLPMLMIALAITLVILGTVLSTCVVFWLGRSMSIVPEARRLVTAGPYSIVRHPLYVAEEIAVVGTILQHLSIWSVLLGVVHWCIQLRRMTNEERILSATFPDYAEYAKRVPRLIAWR
ncbi:methyltransferase family protein [Rhodoplanes sp. Z2-YC6860]|uniref:methyltransferase family protein n=1 Tax=Rhodoplanes sp. Z2-YC6860 TaxID=674703 RepID=UPI00078BC5D6|nr:isoprenylcysteine carboxylmethyltransferase family protein [Rhodoplanes sp. Z2-YC6860]AMN43692.1 Isoprenylcysteine carboxyl methyltransferase [Rhodoplanes sp. Z2-YC6860]